MNSESYNKLFEELEEEEANKKLQEIDSLNRIAFIKNDITEEEDISFNQRN